MAQVTFRIPSSEVRYGYVEVTGEYGELDGIDPDELAASYIRFMRKYGVAEGDANKAPLVKEVPATAAVESILAEGEEKIAKLIVEELNAKVIGVEPNSWDEKPEPKAPAWTTPRTAPASDDDWDL